MKDRKFIKMLSSFSPGELKEFEKFIASPYFSRGRDLLPVFKIIRTLHPNFTHNNFNTEYIFTKLYPEKKFDKSASLNLINTLTHPSSL
ncbi:MAG: hypothetical protein IPM38_10075 [Ignavibacteria bacterium]|nr:hypothetical protein [Ignavibacteria bacterium]